VVQAAARLLTMVGTKRPHSRRGKLKGLGTQVLGKVQGTSVGTCWVTLPTHYHQVGGVCPVSGHKGFFFQISEVGKVTGLT